VSENPEIVDDSETAPEVIESAMTAPAPAADEGTAPAPPKKRVCRRRIAVLAGSVLLLGAVVGGAGYTVVTVQDADRDPGRPSWKFPQADDGKDTAAVEAKGLGGLLMPFGMQGFERGPDLAEFGSDAEFSGRQATALRKESLSGLPPTQRRQLEKQIDRQQIKGVVMRSYVDAQGSGTYADHSYTVGVVLTRMENRSAVRSISTSQNEFLASLDIFRKGPKIKGDTNAKCFLTPKGEKDELDRMFCSAYKGDVLVSITASGVAPLEKEKAAAFISAQLYRIDDTGKAV
jgi:hypothetical protein